ncbi:unnamed protein product [Trifolium pratense]|uniref:Uncharacterized protein n=1 Tax=Trifolium pratense TaxID=57577 RepID=A0ACB0LW77_TRIPR|nr:unnamed protein product [Trifolium pratense]
MENSDFCLVAGHFVFTGIHRTFTGLATQRFLCTSHDQLHLELPTTPTWMISFLYLIIPVKIVGTVMWRSFSFGFL